MSLVGFQWVHTLKPVNRESIQDLRVCYIACRMVGQERFVNHRFDDAPHLSEEISLPQTDQAMGRWGRKYLLVWSFE